MAGFVLALIVVWYVAVTPMGLIWLALSAPVARPEPEPPPATVAEGAWCPHCGRVGRHSETCEYERFAPRPAPFSDEDVSLVLGCMQRGNCDVRFMHRVETALRAAPAAGETSSRMWL